ncbi:MAG TPA: hypothetical protein VK879_19120 [Candidatus Sulfomarinibacteraceae bacterium]|nr:hypothetical protein [Candidatus Sulfomarinibacteraceae bacterium]
MKYVTVLISLVGLLVLAGCGAAEPEPATPTVEPTATAPPAQPTEAVSEPTPTAEAYPSAPEPTEAPDEYPAAEAPALPTGYPPDMMVWMERPWGTQCEDPDMYTYADLREAVTALEGAGVVVQDSEAVELAVCQACDCPTSEHFRVQISAQDMEQAEELGWTRWQ